MKQHQITGLGPVREDGSRDVFTILPNPFVVSAEWLSSWPIVPQVGDYLYEEPSGELHLVQQKAGEEFNAGEAPEPEGGEAKTADGPETEKKTEQGGEISAQTGEAPKVSLPTYIKDGKEVEAWEVLAVSDAYVVKTSVEGVEQETHRVQIELSNGETREAITNAAAVGDWWVVTKDEEGIVCDFVPAANFAAEYQPKA